MAQIKKQFYKKDPVLQYDTDTKHALQSTELLNYRIYTRMGIISIQNQFEYLFLSECRQNDYRW